MSLAFGCDHSEENVKNGLEEVKMVTLACSPRKENGSLDKDGNAVHGEPEPFVERHSGGKICRS